MSFHSSDGAADTSGNRWDSMTEIEQIRKTLARQKRSSGNCLEVGSQKDDLWTKLSKHFDIIETNQVRPIGTEQNRASDTGTENLAILRTHLKRDLDPKQEDIDKTVSSRPSRVWDTLSFQSLNLNSMGSPLPVSRHRTLQQSSVPTGRPKDAPHRNSQMDEIFFNSKRRVPNPALRNDLSISLYRSGAGFKKFNSTASLPPAPSGPSCSFGSLEASNNWPFCDSPTVSLNEFELPSHFVPQNFESRDMKYCDRKIDTRYALISIWTLRQIFQKYRIIGSD